VDEENESADSEDGEKKSTPEKKLEKEKEAASVVE
jgi:hypothetical protein